jgi:hypothetical protein
MRSLAIVTLSLLACNQSTPSTPDLSAIPDLSMDQSTTQPVACTPGMGRTLQGKSCATDGEKCAGGCDSCGAGLYTVNQYECTCSMQQGQLRWACFHGDCFFPCDAQIYTDSQCQVRTVCTDGGVWLHDGG